MKKDKSDYDEKHNQLQNLVDFLKKQIEERDDTIKLNLESKNDLDQNIEN